MNNTTPSQPTRADMSQAPGSDLSFDDLFPVNGESLGVSQAPASGTTPQQPQQPQAAPTTPQAPDFFIRAGQSVYKTEEDAVKGIQHKDELIGRYRQYLETKGINPDTLQEPQTPSPQPATPQHQGPSFTYLNNGKKLHSDLAAAMQANDPEKWETVLRTYNSELLQSQFAPVAPLMAEVARTRAIRQVSSEIPDFNTFIAGEDYRHTLDSLPILKQAVEASENNLEMADKLGELYKLTYLASQGSRKSTEPITPVTPVVATQTPARPTISPSSMTPPQPQAAPNLNTIEGRRQYMQELEQRGIKEKVF